MMGSPLLLRPAAALDDTAQALHSTVPEPGALYLSRSSANRPLLSSCILLLGALHELVERNLHSSMLYSCLPCTHPCCTAACPAARTAKNTLSLGPASQ